MIPALMLVLSVGALGQFGLAYCRSLLAACGATQLSRAMQDAIAPAVSAFEPGEFDRLLGLVRYAPEAQEAGRGLGVVVLYYRLLVAAKWAVSPISREISARIERELTRCTYFAAVTLDRSLALAAN